MHALQNDNGPAATSLADTHNTSSQGTHHGEGSNNRKHTSWRETKGIIRMPSAAVHGWVGDWGGEERGGGCCKMLGLQLTCSKSAGTDEGCTRSLMMPGAPLMKSNADPGGASSVKTTTPDLRVCELNSRVLVMLSLDSRDEER